MGVVSWSATNRTWTIALGQKNSPDFRRAISLTSIPTYLRLHVGKKQCECSEDTKSDGASRLTNDSNLPALAWGRGCAR